MKTIKISSLLETDSDTYIAYMQPTYFINHGGGPCFFLDSGPMRNAWTELETYLSGFASTLAMNRPGIVGGHLLQVTQPWGRCPAWHNIFVRLRQAGYYRWVPAVACC